jgi:hypothetical protein
MNTTVVLAVTAALALLAAPLPAGAHQGDLVPGDEAANRLPPLLRLAEATLQEKKGKSTRGGQQGTRSEAVLLEKQGKSKPRKAKKKKKSELLNNIFAFKEVDSKTKARKTRGAQNSPDGDKSGAKRVKPGTKKGMIIDGCKKGQPTPGC